MRFLGPLKEGCRGQVVLHLPDGDIDFETYFLPHAGYERAAARSGLVLQWIPMEISQEDVEAFGPGFWDAYRRNPSTLAFRATRQ
ncbi:hypothetical protein [Lentzea sp. NPDC059081]|uniref:hypothetical protein n=1 Tax=Lentzea sp. NPDC059081 TaxID=3346719 RepID=UPI003689998C